MKLNSIDKKGLGKKADTFSGFCFDNYKLSEEISEDGEYFAEVASITRDEEEALKLRIKLNPFDVENGVRSYYEPVYVNIERVNSQSSAAGQFVQLFKKVRILEEINGRIVGIYVKLNETRDGRIFKNVTKVFKTDLDDLVFEEKKSKRRPTTKPVDDVIDSDENDGSDEEEIMEEDDDLDLEEEE